jgi:hypothetical protein
VTADAELTLEGLTCLGRESLSRGQVRTRESQVTLSAWRLQTTSAQGPGVILLVELAPPEVTYRGEGVYLGWAQERLAAVWRALSAASAPEAPFDLPQLG